MKKIIFAIYFLPVCILFTSCKKVPVDVISPSAANRSPLAKAGADQTIKLPKDSVSFDGSSSSDPDGSITSYLWAKISGPVSFNIINASASKTAVTNLAAGVYQFQLTVTDNGALSAKDTVQVAVDNPVVNQPPVARAGADQTINLPTNSIILNGSASADPDNNITGYVWAKLSGPSTFFIANANAVQTQVINLVQGAYQFELKVTDAAGSYSTDTVQIIVNAIPQIPDSLGRVTFWTNLSVGDDRLSSIIDITIGNQKKTITHYGGAPSSCTDRGVPYLDDGLFDLTPGVYIWNATYYQYSVSGTITINRGICVLQEIIF